jgi:hypothetical protein
MKVILDYSPLPTQPYGIHHAINKMQYSAQWHSASGTVLFCSLLFTLSVTNNPFMRVIILNVIILSVTAPFG